MSVEKTDSGVNFMAVLLIGFVVLKLVGVINWSWWWVLSPLWIPWIPLIIVLVIALIFVIVGFISGIYLGILEFSKRSK